MKKYLKIIIPVLLLAIIAIVLVKHFSHKKHISNSTVAAITTIQTTPSNPPTNPKQVPVLVYHKFGPATATPETTMGKHYRITPENFDAQMKYLQNNGYTPITFNTYVNYLKTGSPTLPAKPIVLTFDDGWKSQYTYALPILQKYHFVGSFFIITSYPTGNYPAYMTWDQIIALDKDGMEIGSHTVHHLNLAKLDPAKIQSEVVDSKKTLEQELGHPITTFVYPEYGHNAAAETALQNAGYLGARAGWGAYKNSIDHIFEITSQEAVNNPNPFSSKRLPD